MRDKIKNIKMSGKIKLKVREGISKDPRYKTYPYWSWEITGEDGVTTNITPSYAQLKKALIEIFVHEKKVDISRNRKPDAVKWKDFINNVLEESKNNKLLEEYNEK